MRKVKIGRTELDVKWTVIDRMVEHFSPTKGAERLQARVGHAMMSANGYSGASRSRRSLAGWNPVDSDADSDTIRDLPTLRARSRDLVRNAPIAGGAINTAVTNVIGTGLSLQSQVDHELLGISEDQAAAWQQSVEREWLLFAESPDCDITRTQDFYGLQALVFRAALESGDAFSVLVSAKRPGKPVALAVQVIEADRVSNPNSAPDVPGMVQGVKFDALGAPVAYSICSSHPRHRSEKSAKAQWVTIPAFGARTGRRNVLHHFERRRPGQTRGIPFIAAIIEPLKQLERYTEAELMAAVVSGMFTVFIKSEEGANILPSASSSGMSGPVGASQAGTTTTLGNGLIVELNPNESIESANPGRPNAQFDPFVTSIIRQIGLHLEIPYEILVKHYQSSYSAAKAAMNDAWKFFRTRRDWMAKSFCQPVYEAFLEEAVSTGRIVAPGFFADPLIRRAWCKAAWVGDGPGSLDPLKEVTAAEKRVGLTISTLAQESILHDGGDWSAKLRQRAREEKMRKDSGLGPTIQPAASPFAAPQESEPEPDEQKRKTEVVEE